jgi:prepilin-type processing-associated H-X9-DG protein
VTCLSNLKQIGIAITLYRQDYDEAYPNTGDPWLWVGRRFRWPIMPYLNLAQRQKTTGFDSQGGSPATLLCPSDTQSGTSFDATSYAYSAAFYHTSAQVNAMRMRNLIFQLNDPGSGAECISQTEAAVASPSRKGMVAEWFNSHEHSGGSAIGFWGTIPNVNTPGPDRWTGGRNMVFADSHAKFIFASRQTPSVQDCPDINLTPGGLDGEDLR